MRDSDPGDPGPPPGSGNGLAQALAFAAQLGFAIACPMLAFIAGGAWLDTKLGTVPLLLFAGVILGLLTAGGTMYQILRLQSKSAGGKGTGAPYKVEQRSSVGTKPADKRGRDRRNGH